MGAAVQYMVPTILIRLATTRLARGKTIDEGACNAEDSWRSVCLTEEARFFDWRKFGVAEVIRLGGDGQRG
jgi:hypothetical protein